jgi:putative hydrolase of the HAD superfamily
MPPVTQVFGIRMMIILDIDDTVLDHSGAEEDAATRFGREFADRITGYEEASFASMWRAASERHIVAFLAREISFQEQRRRRMREISGNKSMSAEEADFLFDAYLRHYEDSWRAFPDVVPFLEKFGSQSIGIVSDGAQAQQEAKLKAIGIWPHVAFMVTAESSGMSKPDPRMFHQACALARVSPCDACYIGDNLEKDAIGASSAGLRGIWLNRKGRSVPRGIEAIDSLSDFRLNQTLHWNCADSGVA